jgi:hypothetical protein
MATSPNDGAGWNVVRFSPPSASPFTSSSESVEARCIEVGICRGLCNSPAEKSHYVRIDLDQLHEQTYVERVWKWETYEQDPSVFSYTTKPIRPRIRSPSIECDTSHVTCMSLTACNDPTFTWGDDGDEVVLSARLIREMVSGGSVARGRKRQGLTTTYRPSGLHARQVKPPKYPSYVSSNLQTNNPHHQPQPRIPRYHIQKRENTHARLAASTIFIVPSSETNAIACPSGENSNALTGFVPVFHTATGFLPAYGEPGG